jgi:hypothetical protein
MGLEITGGNMEKSTIFIPKKIRVGYDERSDTYTGQLAFVIYYDEKGKLRQETSWENWRDKKIEPKTFDNEPIEGWVINKKVGDYKSDWNHRKAHIRIFDPRGFEFEISVENLLYILENTNSIKGKGLEGKFVYGWDGKDVLLVPTESPDYATIKAYTDIRTSPERFTSKTLVPGRTYLTTKNIKVVYLGAFDYFDYYDREKPDKGKHYFFYDKNENGGWPHRKYHITKNLRIIMKLVSDETAENYAYLMDELQHQPSFSPVDNDHVDYFPYTYEEFYKRLFSRHWDDIWILTGSHYEQASIRSLNSNNMEDSKDSKEIVVSCKNFDKYKYGYKELARGNSLQEVFNKLTFVRKQTYLKNGKTYRSE